MASVQPTSSADVEGSAQGASIDYTQLLRVSLKQQKLLYIADIILEVEEVPLTDLLEWTRANISELLDEIHNSDDNHRIKVSHRNKFAKTVVGIAKSKKQSISNNDSQTPSSSSKMKLLIIGKEEEECIEAIQTGQQYMITAINKMKQLYNDANENNGTIKNKLQLICDKLKQQIDVKQKAMINIIDNIHKYKINELDQRNDITQKAVNIVAKFYNEYEHYFNDDKLTKQDRKAKLMAAREAINNEIQKISKYKEVKYDMDVNMNKTASDQYFAKIFSLCNIGVDVPAVTPQVVGFKLQWERPTMFSQQHNGNDDDNKENKENEATIYYKILYRKQIAIENDEKKNDEEEWQQIDNLVNVTEYDMTSIDPVWEAKIVYNINNILASTESDVVSLDYRDFIGGVRSSEYTAKWSTEYKGDRITLSDNNTKALMARSADQSVRAQYPISKGMIVKLNFIFYYPSGIWDEIFGVVSSECNNGNYNKGVWQDGGGLLKHSYGLLAGRDSTHCYGEQKDLGWTNIKIPKGEEVTIQMIVDYSTYDTCCLSYYINGQFQGPENAKYSMKLPKLQNNNVWYPITCFDYDNNWCKIESV